MALDWHELRTLSHDQLIARGFGNWDGRLALIPHRLYAAIPAGFELESVTGRTLTFVPGETDDDQRYGYLAYGIPCGESK